MPSQKLSPDARRIRAMIVSLPMIAITSYVLYKRLVLGEEQRRLPQEGPLLSVKTIVPQTARGATDVSRTSNSTADNPEHDNSP